MVLPWADSIRLGPGYETFTWICFGFTSGRFGMVILSTPLS
jgi:hypothetical protein